MRHFFLMLSLVSQVVTAQECLVLTPDVLPMGYSRVAVDLESTPVETLPVVFHVVHTGLGDANNISDEQIESQVDVLNETFLDSKIQFCMASRTPGGVPTNGITRFDGGVWSSYLEDGVAQGSPNGIEDATLKASVGCWNPDEYINIYVVSEINGNNGGSGTQGYAYLGPTGDCRDGIVALYNTVGNVGELKQGRDLGYTVVHEVGHYLSLYHTFYNSNDCEESNCETQGDRVCDTPPGLASNGCSNTCPDINGSNYMDYSSQNCKIEFTEGQACRMHESLQGPRSALVVSPACLPVVAYDMTPSTAYYQEQWCTPYQDIWVEVINQGVQTIPFVDVTLYCNGLEYLETLFDVAPGGYSVFFEQVYIEDAQMFEVQTASIDDYPDNDYASWPLETVVGDLFKLYADIDTWSNEHSWMLLDSNGDIVMDDDYGFNEDGLYYYEACVFDDCYTFVAEDYAGDGFCTADFGEEGCDIGSDGYLAMINQETIISMPFGFEFEEFSQDFCNTLPACELDYDGNGSIGNGDILVMLSEWACDFACQTDPNNDGIVNVRDLLYMLFNVGECDIEIEDDFSVGTYIDLVADEGINLGGRRPRVFDILGREIDAPFEQLATGVYILKWKNKTKKVFVQ